MNSMRLAGYFLLLILCLQGQAQSFGCGDSLYAVFSPSITLNSELYVILVDKASGEAAFSQLASLDRQIDAVGHRISDNLLYGVDRHSQEIVRIYPDGTVESLGLAQGLDSSYRFYAGTVHPSGRSLLLIGRNAEGKDDRIFLVSLTSPTLNTGWASIVSDEEVQIHDVAYDPVYGVMYAFDSIQQRLITLRGGTGQVNNHLYPVSGNVSWMGSIFFDSQGQLYGFGSNGSSSESSLFKIDKFTGAIENLDSGPNMRFSDGCSCPFTMRFEKMMVPEKVIPCSELRVKYRFWNRGGSGHTLRTFRDTLPPGFRFVEIERDPYIYSSLNGLGTGLLEITDIAINLGRDSMVFRIEVDEEANGRYESQAWADQFPFGMGGLLPSDNPYTLVERDPSPVEVIVPDSLELEQQLQLLCIGDTATLTAPAGAISYLWSTGETNPSIELNEGGWYWVVFENECGFYSDSIYVEVQSELLSIDLGPDQFIEAGNMLALSAESNQSGFLDYKWSSSQAIELDCYDCPQPSTSPLVSSFIYLQVKDQFGCEAFDTLYVELSKNRKIYCPTAFSPNGDGRNEVFYLQGFGPVEMIEFQVFNRWGKLVFQHNGGMINQPDQGWNGYGSTGQQAEGVYIWRAALRFPDQEIEQFSGSVHLIR